MRRNLRQSDKTGRDQTRLLKQPFVAGGVRLPSRGPVVEVRQFGQDDCGLERIEAEVAAHQLVVVFGLGAMGTEYAQLLRPLRVICDDHSAVAKGAEVLGWKEGEAAVRAERAG